MVKIRFDPKRLPKPTPCLTKKDIEEMLRGGAAQSSSHWNDMTVSQAEEYLKVSGRASGTVSREMC